MPPVRGLFKPIESLPEFAALVPERIPGAMTSLLCFPKGSQVGITSFATTIEVRPLPPNPRYASGVSSIVALNVDILIRNSFPIITSPSLIVCIF
jgi:hypothetical protein